MRPTNRDRADRAGAAAAGAGQVEVEVVRVHVQAVARARIDDGEGKCGQHVMMYIMRHDVSSQRACFCNQITIIIKECTGAVGGAKSPAGAGWMQNGGADMAPPFSVRWCGSDTTEWPAASFRTWR